MSEAVKQQTQSLLNYMHEIAKLNRKIVLNLSAIQDFALFEGELKNYHDISVSLADDLFTKPKISVSFKDIPIQPELPEELEDWVILDSQPPHSKPEIIEKREVSTAEEAAEFSADPELEKSFAEYLADWENWKAEFDRFSPQNELYKELFKLKNRLAYEEKKELVLGYALLLWSTAGKSIKYPLLTHNMLIEHDSGKDIIEILAPDDCEWQLELDQLNEVINQDLSSLNQAFVNFEYAEDEEESKRLLADLLFQVKGLAPEGKILPSPAEPELSPDNSLKIITGWTLFVRDKSNDYLLNDIEGFQELLESDSVSFTPLLEEIFDNNSEDRADQEIFSSSSEWDSLLDPEILFPKEINEEQVKILDYLQDSPGVVVQGPPGTGKSHTIANLISHFIAQGQRVLVTSQKEQALKVLHKMLPAEIKPLTLSVLSNDRNRRDKLEKAVAEITEIGRNISIYELEAEKDHLRREFFTVKDRLEGIKQDMLILSHSAKPVYLDWIDEVLSPAEAQSFLESTKKTTGWLQAEFDYQITGSLGDEREAVKFKANYPLRDNDLKKAYSIWAGLGSDFPDLIKYKLPEMDKLLTSREFKLISEKLHQIQLLSEKLSDYYHDVHLTDNPEVLNEVCLVLQEELPQIQKLQESWALDFAESYYSQRSKLSAVISELDFLFAELKSCQKQRNLIARIEIDSELELADYLDYLEVIKERITRKRKPVGLLSSLNFSKNRALKKIRINGKRPAAPEEWLDVYHEINYRLSAGEFLQAWNSLRANFPEVEIAEIQSSSFTEIQEVFLLWKYALDFVFTFREELNQAIDRVILGHGDNLQADLLNNPKKVLQFLKLKKEQLEIKDSIQEYDRVKEYLAGFLDEAAHPLAHELNNCLQTDYSALKEKYGTWERCYQKLEKFNNAGDELTLYREIIAKIASQAPDWADKLLSPDVTPETFHLQDWKQAWSAGILEDYLEKISSKEAKIAELDRELLENQKKLKRIKEELVAVKTKIELKQKLSSEILKALMMWKNAMDKLGKGTGKFAPRHRKTARKYMQRAKEAVPAWIMPVHQVSETTTKGFGVFDIVIVDEASQCDIRSLLVLLRAEKIIVVGDDKQISPSPVGIPQDKINQLQQQYIHDFPNYEMLDLSSSLYDIAQILFARRSLMLKEHFRCLPEIIEFSNRNFYQDQIIPLRNVPPRQRLEPVLETVYVKDGWRDSNSKTNKAEARAICSKIKELFFGTGFPDEFRHKNTTSEKASTGNTGTGKAVTENTVTENTGTGKGGTVNTGSGNTGSGNASTGKGATGKGRFENAGGLARLNKTVGVISLTGNHQAKLILNEIDNYLSPKQQDEIKFHVGDAYAFQGDERDVIILSMVVGGDDDNFISLSKRMYEQRFNVATSRARDKLILFHSVQLGRELTNPEDLRYRLLNYLQNGFHDNSKKQEEARLAAKLEKCDSPFEEAVLRLLDKKGYQVQPQVKVGRYRIDLVVQGEKNQLAIECDGDRYHTPEVWWEDKNRQRQLERTGWIFERISGTSFFRNQEKAIQPVLRRLAELEIYPNNKPGIHLENSKVNFQKQDTRIISNSADAQPSNAARGLSYAQNSTDVQRANDIQRSNISRHSSGSVSANPSGTKHFSEDIEFEENHSRTEKKNRKRVTGKTSKNKNNLRVSFDRDRKKEVITALDFEGFDNNSHIIADIVDKKMLKQISKKYKEKCFNCNINMELVYGSKGFYLLCSECDFEMTVNHGKISEAISNLNLKCPKNKCKDKNKDNCKGKLVYLRKGNESSLSCS